MNVLTAPTDDEVVVAHTFVTTAGESITPYDVSLDEGDYKFTRTTMKLLCQLAQEGQPLDGDRMGVSKSTYRYCGAILKEDDWTCHLRLIPVRPNAPIPSWCR